jgi:hypothetical protein
MFIHYMPINKCMTKNNKKESTMTLFPDFHLNIYKSKFQQIVRLDTVTYIDLINYSTPPKSEPPKEAV